MKKYLLLLATVIVIWLFINSYFYYQLRYNKYNLELKQHELEQSKYKLALRKQTIYETELKQFSDYELGVMKLKLGDSSSNIPLLINKKTGVVYRYFIDLKTQEQGWQPIVHYK